MKVVKAGYQILNPQTPTKHIERIARVCYKSEDKICEGSDIKMIKSLLSRQHLAMIEHASVCLEVDKALYELLHEIVSSEETFTAKDIDSRKNYLRFTEYMLDKDTPDEPVYRYLVSGNMRAWYEFMEYYTSTIEDTSLPFVQAIVDAAGGEEGVLGKWHWSKLSDCDEEKKYTLPDSYAIVVTDFSTLSDEERWVHECISVHFTVDRGVTHEMVRMRDCSFAQESTRYCNYSQGKFGSDITVIKPCFWVEGSPEYAEWEDACKLAERSYIRLTNTFKTQPQQARSVLPQSTKAEIVMTTNLREWHHILSLRACDSTGPAHPQMKEVMIPLLLELKSNDYFARIFKDLEPAA